MTVSETIDIRTVRSACEALRDDMISFLDRLVRFESIAGFEGPAMHWLAERFDPLADLSEEVPVPESITDDPEFSETWHGQPYEGRPNVRVLLKGDGSGGSVIFNAHADVVPPTKRQERPFDPYIRDGAMYGRGTCDDKGQIAVLWTVLAAMKALGVRPAGDVILHLVIEEEPGGNGALALVRRGERADCCINLEPCSNRICPSVRGSVWFRGTVEGRAGHSGSATTTVSALKMAMEAIRIIEEYHDELFAETRDVDPLFAGYENPMPVNFGELHAGDWPTIAPEHAEFSGMFGYLTTPRDTVIREIVERIGTRGPEWLRDHCHIRFPYRHESSRLDPAHPLVTTLAGAYDGAGIHPELSGVTSSMDAWLYSHLLGIPTLATGCGSLGDAHTVNEHVILDEIIDEAAALILFIARWCGLG